MSAAQLLNPKAESRVGSAFPAPQSIADNCVEAWGSSPGQHLGWRRPATGLMPLRSLDVLVLTLYRKVLASNLGPRGTLKMCVDSTHVEIRLLT